ncbi:MAG TPA: tetratricopeptide repeat protein, partial [Anaerolineae bacterium]|nr:tetratricopeptide repeat protein [Anaerolineae bacterium]
QEFIFDVTGLTLPQNDAAANPLAFDAVKLFMQRAQQIRHDYNPPSFAPILETCRLVGGSPLAIELAASWIRQLSPREIADNVAKSLDFLASRNRNMPPRHRSLQAVFDHSWHLLADTERAVLAKLAVFPAEFDATAAHAVAGATLPMLLALADKSLLNSQSGRFTLHALVRNFSYQQMDQHTAAQAEINLANYFADWIAEQLDAKANTIDQELVSAEISNIRSAWQFAITHTLPPVLTTMLAPLFAFFVQRGWFKEGIERFTHALPISNDPAALLIRRARFYIFLADFDSAEQDLATTLTLPHIPQIATSVLGYRAIIQINQGNHQAAQQLALECLQAAKKIDDPQLTAFALNLVGGLHKMRGDYVAAQSSYTEGLAIRRAVGDRTGEAVVLNNLGNLAQVQGKYGQASTYYEQSSQLFKALNQPARAAVTLSNAGRLAWLAEKFTQAQSYLNEALTIRRKHGNQWGIANTSLNLCHVLLSLNQPTATAKVALEIKQIAEQHAATPLLHELYIIVAKIAATNDQVELQYRLLTHVLAQEDLSGEIKQLATENLATLSQSSMVQPTPSDDPLDTAITRLLKAVAVGD